MKEVVITAPFQYEIRKVPIPKPNKGEVLVQMKAAGVCGSDFHIFKGGNPCASYPLVPGHENVGVVAAVGEDVANVKPGDHVVVDLIITCGTCYQCTHGRKNVCADVQVRGSSTHGGWREYFTTPESDVYPISPSIPWKDAALIEPFAIGGHCVGRAQVTDEDTVLVLGAGTLGSIIVQTCKAHNAKVICADIDDSVLERAKIYGADLVVNTKREDLAQQVEQFTEGHLCTVAFDAACFPGSLASLLAPGLVGNAGRVVPMGFCTEPEPINQAMIVRRELDIIASRMSAYQFAPTAENMAQGKYQTDGLISDYISFENIEQVFEKIRNPKPQTKKIVILFDE